MSKNSCSYLPKSGTEDIPEVFGLLLQGFLPCCVNKKLVHHVEVHVGYVVVFFGHVFDVCPTVLFLGRNGSGKGWAT